MWVFKHLHFVNVKKNYEKGIGISINGQCTVNDPFQSMFLCESWINLFLQPWQVLLHHKKQSRAITKFTVTPHIQTDQALITICLLNTLPNFKYFDNIFMYKSQRISD